MSTFSVFFSFHVPLASLLYLSRRFGVSRSACWNVMELKNTRFFFNSLESCQRHMYFKQYDNNSLV
jgi:hypothetical protein